MGVRDDNSFLLKKAPILNEHVKAESELRTRLAARGFTFVPGHGHENLVLLEIDTKMRLTEANASVLQEAIRRYVEEQGVRLEAETTAARAEFLVRKTILFNDLAKEMADLKALRSRERADLDMIGIQLSLREVGLLILEADINAEIEGLKRLQLDAEAMPLAKEVEYAEGKLDLARERLKLIDPIRMVIAEQRKVLLYEQDEIVPLTESLIVEKQSLIDLQIAELIPAMVALSDAIKRWAAARPAVVSALTDKAQAVTNLASREEALTVFLVAAARAKLDYATTLDDLLPLRADVAAAEVNRALNLVFQADADLLLATAEKELAEEQQQKLNPLQDKAEALMRYAQKQASVAAAMSEDVGYRRRAATAKILAASYRIAAMNSEIDYLLADVESDKAKMSIDIVRSELNYLEKEGEALRLSKEVEGLSEVGVAKAEFVTAKEGKMSSVVASKEARILTELSERLRWRRTAALKKIGAEREYHSRFGYDRYYEQTRVAEINAMKTVTAQLLHAIA